MFLKACLNGSRLPAEHPRLPTTPAAIAADAARVVAAGADAVHLHVKDQDGADTLDGEAMSTVLEAVRSVVAGVPIGVTTGAWASPDPDDRLQRIRQWSTQPARPDFASVNWHEAGADEIAHALLSMAVGVEAGLWHHDGVDAWARSPYRDDCCRILLELPDDLGAAATVVEADRLVEHVRIVAHPAVPLLLHGEGSSCWPAVDHALRIGLQARIGLEDVLVLPDGSPAVDNAALVTAARSLHLSRTAD